MDVSVSHWHFFYETQDFRKQDVFAERLILRYAVRSGLSQVGNRLRIRSGIQSANDADPASANAPSTLAEKAYRRLRQDIVTNVFAPGQPLRLELLKQRYGLSFSPLREALTRLHAERLVVTIALRGFSVAPVSVSEMWDATETRVLIESEALRRSIARGDDDWEAAIVSSFHALDLQVRRTHAAGGSPSTEQTDALEIRHKEFHKALLARCGSRRLVDLSDQLHMETQRYRLPALAGTDPATNRDVRLEHQQIMDAALERRTEDAVGLLAAHYRRTAEGIESYMSPPLGRTGGV